MAKTKHTPRSSNSLPKKAHKQTSSSKSGTMDESEDSDSSSSTHAATKVHLHPGTHWPLDATLELYITYEAAKEIRTVKKEFYPLLYHLTKLDFGNVAKSLSKHTVIMEHLQARMSKKKNADSDPEGPPKLKPVSPGKPTAPIKDLKKAKEEMQQLLSRISLKKEEYSQILQCVEDIVEKRCGKPKDTSAKSQKKPDHSPRGQRKTNHSTKEKIITDQVGEGLILKGQSTESPTSHNTRAQTRSSTSSNISVKRLGKNSVNCGKFTVNNSDMTVAQIKRFLAEQSKELEELSTSKNMSISKKDSKAKISLTKKESTGSGRGRGRPKKDKATEAQTSDKAEIKSKKSVKDTDVNALTSNSSVNSFSTVSSSSSPTNDSIVQSTSSTDIFTPPPHESPPSGPFPVCLYKVEEDLPPTGDATAWMISPKVEIDNAESDVADENCFPIIEADTVKGKCTPTNQKPLNTNTGVLPSDKPLPLIKTICTGPVCGGNNCRFEHSVIMEESDDEMDCVQITDPCQQEAKEAEPVIIIDD